MKGVIKSHWSIVHVVATSSFVYFKSTNYKYWWDMQWTCDVFLWQLWSATPSVLSSTAAQSRHHFNFFHVWYYERRLSKKIDSIPCQVMNFYISNTSMLFDPELHSREKHWKKKHHQWIDSDRFCWRCLHMRMQHLFSGSMNLQVDSSWSPQYCFCKDAIIIYNL